MLKKRKRKSLMLFGCERNMLCNARRLWLCEIRSKRRKKWKIKTKVQKEKMPISLCKCEGACHNCGEILILNQSNILVGEKIEISNLCIDFERIGS